MASTANLVLEPGLKAGADLSGDQFTFVKISAASTVIRTALSADENTIGVLQNKPTLGKTADVAVRGSTKVKLGATVAAGIRVMSDTAGRAVAHTSGTNANKGLGILKTGGAINEIVSMILEASGASA